VGDRAATIGLGVSLDRLVPAPMYFAGRLESGNVIRYQVAASHAAALGLREFEADLLVMARVEKEHELFFLNIIAGHRLLPIVAACSVGEISRSHPRSQSRKHRQRQTDRQCLFNRLGSAILFHSSCFDSGCAVRDRPFDGRVDIDREQSLGSWPTGIVVTTFLLRVSIAETVSSS